MNKKKTIVLGLALFLMMGAASLAYFTDVKRGTANAEAGVVEINNTTVVVNAKLMVPGDSVPVEISANYVGNVKAKTRVKLTKVTESVKATSTEGFRLMNDINVLNLDEPIFITTNDVQDSGTAISLPLVLELQADSKNPYQASTYSVEYEIQVLQDAHTTWDTIGAGLIVAK